MDAVKFCEESRRMCNANKCAKCPSSAGHFCKIALHYTNISSDAKVAIVEQWAKEHSVKTRQSVFLEQWPNAPVNEDGVLFCPKTVNTAHFCRCKDKGCGDCRREFWMQEVK